MHARHAVGPLSVLEKSVGKGRVCVVVRETHGVRGFVWGRVVAFDRHFNVVLVKAVVCDRGKAARKVGTLFIRGENVVLVRRAVRGR